MNVMAVIGSPHKSGPSATLTLQVAKGAEDAGHNVEIIWINDMNVRGCQGCGYCKDNSADCVVQDDLLPYWEKLHSSDALIVSAPNYASQVAGPMITYMNRHFCLIDKDWNPRIHPGIKLIGIFSQGQSDVEKYRAYYDWYLADFQNRDMALTDMLIHTREMSIEEDSPLMRRAYELGKSL